MGINILPGGFFGVDVFFVISGYLITNILIFQSTNYNNVFFDFYIKRIKRIIPAYLAMSIVTLIFSLLFLDAESLSEFGKSLSFASIFLANFYFLFNVGYFAQSALLKPLLHCWSLSIEEQFYLFYPIIFIFVNMYFYKYIKQIFISLAFLSFSCFIYFNSQNPSVSFYLLPTRGWELLSGALIVMNKNKISKISKNISRFLFILSFILLLSSFCFLNSKSPFWGIAYLLPICSTAIIIASAENISTIIYKNRISDLLVSIGKISYSLYLWHWPLYCGIRYLLLRDLKGVEVIVYLVVLFCISFLSWKFVEMPFRLGNYQTKLLPIKSFFLVTIFLIFFGIFISYKKGLPNRFIENSLLVNAHNDLFWKKLANSETYFISSQKIKKEILIGDSLIKPKTILWGDSHAIALALGIDLKYKKLNKSVIVATLNSTPPLLEVKTSYRRGPNMVEFNKNVLSYIAQNNNLDTVILCARWSSYFYSKNNENELPGNNHFLLDQFSFETTGNSDESKLVFKNGLIKTIVSLLALKKVIYIVTPVPELLVDPRNIMGKIRFQKILDGNRFSIRSIESNATNSIQEYNRTQSELLYFFEQLKYRYGVNLIDISKKLSVQSNFIFLYNNELLYRDVSHLSKFGSVFVSSIFP